MPYQVLAKGSHHSAADEVWRGDTLEEAREKAKRWLSTNGKPGEALAEVWDEDGPTRLLTMLADAHGYVHEGAETDLDQARTVWAYLREVAGQVVPGRYDFDHKEYRFAVRGGYTVAATREFLRETRDIPSTLKEWGVTLERIQNTGTEHKLVLTSHGIETRSNQA